MAAGKQKRDSPQPLVAGQAPPAIPEAGAGRLARHQEGIAERHAADQESEARQTGIHRALS